MFEYILKVFSFTLHLLHPCRLSIIDVTELPAHPLNLALSLPQLFLQLRDLLLVLPLLLVELALFLESRILQTLFSLPHRLQVLMKLSLLLLTPLYQYREVLLRPFQFMCKFDLPLRQPFIVKLDLFQLVLQLSALIDNLLPLKLRLFHLKCH